MLRSKLIPTFVFALALGLFASDHSTAALDGASKERQVLIELSGTALGYEIGGPGSGILGFDSALYDPASGRYLGRGTDILDLTSIEGGDPFAGENFVMTNMTTFNLPGGTITTQNRTSLAMFTQGSVAPFEDEVTHSTSDFSRGVITGGTGRYAGITGTVQLSGAVDMGQFTGGPGSPITFNCLFSFDLD